MGGAPGSGGVGVTATANSLSGAGNVGMAGTGNSWSGGGQGGLGNQSANIVGGFGGMVTPSAYALMHGVVTYGYGGKGGAHLEDGTVGNSGAVFIFY